MMIDRKKNPVFICFALLCLFLGSVVSLQAKEKAFFTLETVDGEKFPLIQLLIRDKKGFPVEKESVQIRESLDGATRYSKPVRMYRDSRLEPVHLFFLIQSANSVELNNFSHRFVSEMIKNADDRDRFSFAFFSDELLVIERKLIKSEALRKLQIPGSLHNDHTGANLELALQKTSSLLEPGTFPILLAYDEKIHLSDELKQALFQIPVPVYFYGQNSGPNRYFSEISGGELFPLSDSESGLRILSELEYFRKSPTILEYESPFSRETAVRGGSQLKVEVQLGQKQTLTTQYEVPFYRVLWNTFLQPQIFYPAMAFLLLLTVSSLVILRWNSRLSQKERSGGRKSPVGETWESMDRSGYEDEIYKRVYGEVRTTEPIPQRKERAEFVITERAYPTYTQEEFEEGEEYEKAFLLVKEGRNPGRQFSIHQPEITIGSSELCDMVVYDASVSPTHARIRMVKGKFVLYDLVSQRGTFLNGRKLLRPRLLYDFDEILLGKCVLVFRGK